MVGGGEGDVVIYGMKHLTRYKLAVGIAREGLQAGNNPLSGAAELAFQFGACLAVSQPPTATTTDDIAARANCGNIGLPSSHLSIVSIGRTCVRSFWG
ncbi:hypothetical protein J6590_010745 [Homalodisca vitripennis]|nr:hypothetical protein J6590_010745 [Homalodisca vitripennis]